MTSREYAEQLRETAEILESRPEFEMPTTRVVVSYYGEKDKFIAAVRALKPGRKSIDEDAQHGYVNFYPTGTCLRLYINRLAVCRKVQDAKYECEPLLSAEEEGA